MTYTQYKMAVLDFEISEKCVFLSIIYILSADLPTFFVQCRPFRFQDSSIQSTFSEVCNEGYNSCCFAVTVSHARVIRFTVIRVYQETRVRCVPMCCEQKLVKSFNVTVYKLHVPLRLQRGRSKTNSNRINYTHIHLICVFEAKYLLNQQVIFIN